MLINWFTVGAQALNFVILVGLMKHFLYGPILRAIDEREKQTAAELATAASLQAEAKKEREEFQTKDASLERQRVEQMARAESEAKAEGGRLLAEARGSADALSAKRQESLQKEARDLGRTLRMRTGQEVMAIARKALADLASTSLEERIGEVFTRRLREMDGPAKSHLGDALKAASEPATVRSAFELPAEQRAAIQNALNETFSAEVRIRFDTSPELISGIELTTDGQTLEWSLASYLTSLEKGVVEILKEGDEVEARAQPKPEAKVEPRPAALQAQA